MSKIVVAFYEKADYAQQIGKALESAGITPGSFSILAGENGSSNGQGLVKSGEALVGELGKLGISQDETQLYTQGLKYGGGLVVARIDDAKIEEVSSVLESQPLVDIEERIQQWQGESQQQQGGKEQGGQPQRQQEGQTVQAVEEELQVGKRQTSAGRVLIHTHVEEQPVEERIRLRQEELQVQRKQVSRTLSPEEADQALQERTVEVSATREQAVVSKQARVTEEVTIAKQQGEREEVVRDTVRKTRLDVEEQKPEKQDA